MTTPTKELLALVADWRRAAHQLRGDCEPMPASAMRLDECADELEAALASDTGERGVDWLPDAVDRHQLLAGDCPKQAMVVLASSLRRLIAKHGAALRAQPAAQGGGEAPQGIDSAHTPQGESLCSDCPPADHGDTMRCAPCPRQTTPPESGGQGEAVEYRLWDSQWVNVVNHDRAYAYWEMEAAIHHAVKLTEQAMAKNIADGKWPPVRALAQGGGNER